MHTAKRFNCHLTNVITSKRFNDIEESVTLQVRNAHDTLFNVQITCVFYLGRISFV